MRSRTLRALAVVAGLALLAAACGDDDEAADDDVDAEEPADEGESEETEGVTVVVANDGIEVPAEIAGGAVEVTVEGSDGEVNFSRVEDGTTEEDFAAGIGPLLEGGPAPDFLLANAGAAGGGDPSTILLEPGSYIVWTESGGGGGGGDEPADDSTDDGGDDSTGDDSTDDLGDDSTDDSGDDSTDDTGDDSEDPTRSNFAGGDSTDTTEYDPTQDSGDDSTGAVTGEGDDDSDDPTDDSGDDSGDSGDDSGDTSGGGFLTASTTVTEGEGDAELPETDGTITAADYEFEIDVEAGDTFTFENDGPDQLHHAVLFNFGDTEAGVVEENLLGFLQSDEGGPPPEALAGVDFSQLEAGGSGVFSPDLGGTFSASLESGNTYAAVCFLSDLQGGPPHAFGNEMFEVFTVD